ncbi:hypothetical protein CFC21_107606 [Triticum aestivum]|uniref:Uncharacterized protein n=2 Tax=Triticum aestivum TaxID=4565 RepID=A0A3B6TL96_WHEAT|nr:disease resistance protein RGA2-like [Triticum aestivum]XP_044443844.1 disease resistance protein RGA2-like [Triticum aestivum]KAF7106904.1 hypothetical protein CFC21_107606 [Triticum aestivum]
MAESLLLPLVRGVVGKATDALVQTVTRMCGLDDDRETLERHLLAVECKLANAEEKSQKNAYLKSWMEKLKSVAYEADDILDDFQYEALRREAQIGKSTSLKVLGYITRRSPLLFRFAMSRKLKGVLEKINKLVNEMNKFGLENSVHQQEPQLPWRQTYSKLDESTDIFGRDDDKERVVKLLLDQQDQQKVQVLPIFGMGGLGKTTLAKMVYNDQKVQQHFQLKMWHCVSDNFDVSAIVKSIIKLANGTCDQADSIELLQKKLGEVIGQKRFFLVLDDVWNEEKKLWKDELKPLLCSVGGPGSVIVVTCRSKQVASIMQTVDPVELAFLSKEDSWELFSNKAFSNGAEEQTELVTIGKRIVNKCGGLPLALKTMGGLLSSKQQVHEWKTIEETNIGDNVGGKYGVMPILKLSYKYLSSEMKQCFALCAVFHKDYEMEKDMLIQLWMANGFIQAEGTMDLTQKGEFIFHELIWRSFLQDMKAAAKSAGYASDRAYGTIVCKMHDLMHDLAKDVSNECATIEELIEQKSLVKNVCHLQMSEVELEKTSMLFDGKTSLRTLLALSWMQQDFKRLPHVSLRALHWLGSRTSLKAINAKHLRYLDLSHCSVNSTLLDSLCLLYNMQTLRLNYCEGLRQFPEDMVMSLRKLIHIYLYGCSSLERTPRNIGQLNNLHTLTRFIVDTRDGCGIEELKDLRHLSNRLELYSLRKIKSVNHAKEANLQQKQNLSELLFCWGRSVLCSSRQEENEACNEEEVFQHLEPHSKIKKFELYGYGGPEIPRWMRDPQMFQCLRKLTISNWTRCKNIPVVWLSPSLEFLHLNNLGKLKTLCDNLCIEGGGRSTPLQIFPKLKEMVLEQLPSLEGWAENSAGVATDSSVIFPVFEKLVITRCPKVASFPLSPVLKDLRLVGYYLEVEYLPRLRTSLEILWIQCFEGLVALPSNLGDLAKLRELRVHSCRSLEGLPDGMDGVTSLRELVITHCRGIEEFPNGLLERLPALDYLTIVGCPELQRRCREGGEYFHHLVPIPYKRIPAESVAEPESESSEKRFPRRLLPCCVHSKSDSESDNN